MGKVVQGTGEATLAEEVTLLSDLVTSGTGFFMVIVVSLIFDGALRFTALFLASFFCSFEIGSLDFTPQRSAKLRANCWQQGCLQILCVSQKQSTHW